MLRGLSCFLARGALRKKTSLLTLNGSILIQWIEGSESAQSQISNLKCQIGDARHFKFQISYLKRDPGRARGRPQSQISDLKFQIRSKGASARGRRDFTSQISDFTSQTGHGEGEGWLESREARISNLRFQISETKRESSLAFTLAPFIFSL